VPACVVSAYGSGGLPSLSSLLRRIAEEVERRRSLRESFRELSSSWDGICLVASVTVKASEGSQKRLATLWFCVAGVVDVGKIVGLPAQDGELFWEGRWVRSDDDHAWAWANGYDTYEYNAQVASLLRLKLAISTGELKVRQGCDFGIDLTEGRGRAVVDGTRREDEDRKRRVSGMEVGNMLELFVGRS
jgi:hypothetical protein